MLFLDAQSQWSEVWSVQVVKKLAQHWNREKSPVNLSFDPLLVDILVDYSERVVIIKLDPVERPGRK